MTDTFHEHLDRLGIPIFPITLGRTKDAHTFPVGWPKLAARGNAKRLANREPWNALAAVTGHRHIVLDIDPRNGGNREQVVLDLMRMRVTVHAETNSGGGGSHLYVRANPGIRSTRHLPRWPGVDILAAGKCAYLPGGGGRPEHNYKQYTVETDNLDGLLEPLDDGDIQLAEFIADQIRLRDIRKPRPDREPTAPVPGNARPGSEPWGRRGKQYLGTVLAQRCKQLAGEPKGGRHYVLLEAALVIGSLCAGFTAPPDVIAAATDLLTAASPLPQHETETTVNSGLRIGQGNPWLPPSKSSYTREWAHQKAEQWLKDQLTGELVPRQEIFAKAEVDGFNEKAVKRAATTLKVTSIPQRTFPATTLWTIPQLGQNNVEEDDSQLGQKGVEEDDSQLGQNLAQLGQKPVEGHDPQLGQNHVEEDEIPSWKNINIGALVPVAPTNLNPYLEDQLHCEQRDGTQ